MGKALYKMLVIQTFRSDRLLAMASIFVATVLGESFKQAAEQELDLGTVVSVEVRLLFSLRAWCVSSPSWDGGDVDEDDLLTCAVVPSQYVYLHAYCMGRA